MKSYIEHHEWKIIEKGFFKQWNRITESLCSLGNGYMGLRGNFEEKYSGDSLQGTYLAGIYYPDKTRVGWWKNGYPEYFAKVLNTVNWIGIDIKIDGQEFDINQGEIDTFYRELDMQHGTLRRKATVKTSAGTILIDTTRFCSLEHKEVGVIQYKIKLLDFEGSLNIKPYLDFNIKNEDSNYDEKFWNPIEEKIHANEGHLVAQTKKTAFKVCASMKYDIYVSNTKQDSNYYNYKEDKYIASESDYKLLQGQELIIYKYVSITNSFYHNQENLVSESQIILDTAYHKGYDSLLENHCNLWKEKWRESDIQIEGDVAAQQGIRFCIFHMNQTYTGEDERLNIGPKGFTGEKYGGSTYWDTEAYCLPFYLSTADQKVARNLLVYRHRHLHKAIENAEKLGFYNGAALYPMVTINGEECHNEWEITFEEIHRNGAIAYAIYDYINYTGDKKYLITHGLEVLIAISRFWKQRVNHSEVKNKFVILGVTGPNEYENNVNNNWYTNYIATWCLKYTIEAIDYVKSESPETYELLKQSTKFFEKEEVSQWKDIINNMYYPYDENKKIFLQQEGFLDKRMMPIDEIPHEQRPINQHWSWDRILRSCFIKQADVLQGLYFFEDDFDINTIKRNFNFYEPLTVHESSLSPCVHTILAAKIKNFEKAYEMYLRTARLDIDDYNNDTEDGLHITSMAGTWMAFVKGFGGMRVNDGVLKFSPFLPVHWKSYSFKVRFRDVLLKINVFSDKIYIDNESKNVAKLNVFDENIDIPPLSAMELKAKGTLMY